MRTRDHARCPARRARACRLARCIACLLMCGAPAGAGAGDMYVTYSKRGMPIFTDVPPDAAAQRVFSAPVRTGPAPATMPPYRARPPGVRSAAGPGNLTALVEDAARRHRLDVALLMGVIDVESRFRSDALSPAGAMGLMQLMPQTARRFGVHDPWEPRANIEGGSRYLRHLLDLFDGDLRLALAGYNAGEQNVIAAGRRVPAIEETRRYVPAVLERVRHWTQALERDRGAP